MAQKNIQTYYLDSCQYYQATRLDILLTALIQDILFIWIRRSENDHTGFLDSMETVGRVFELVLEKEIGEAHP